MFFRPSFSPLKFSLAGPFKSSIDGEPDLFSPTSPPAAAVPPVSLDNGASSQPIRTPARNKKQKGHRRWSGESFHKTVYTAKIRLDSHFYNIQTVLRHGAGVFNFRWCLKAFLKWFEKKYSCSWCLFFRSSSFIEPSTGRSLCTGYVDESGIVLFYFAKRCSDPQFCHSFHLVPICHKASYVCTWRFLCYCNAKNTTCMKTFSTNSLRNEFLRVCAKRSAITGWCCHQVTDADVQKYTFSQRLNCDAGSSGFHATFEGRPKGTFYFWNVFVFGIC